jgi:ketosteroid isomerase-like protein
MTELDTLNRDNTALVRRAIDAISAGDAQSLLNLMADDVEFRMNGHTPFSRHCHDKNEFLQLFAEVGAFLEAFIPLHIDNLIPAGDWVIAETRGDARMKKDGSPYRNHYCMLWRIRDGRIVSLTEYNDSQLIMEKFFPDRLGD